MSPAATITIPQNGAPCVARVPSYDLNSQRSSNSSSVVFVVDDDVYVQESLELLIRSQGWIAQTFESAEELLAWSRPVVPNCLILACSSPCSSCIEVQRRIARARPEMPIIVISGYVDIPTTVQVIKAGAVDYLIKPCNSELLLCAIRQSLTRSRRALNSETELHNLWNRYELLTPREKEVLALVASGLSNKEVGGELGISEVTVKFHRGNLMRKMAADSFAELVNMAARLRIKRTFPCAQSSGGPMRWYTKVQMGCLPDATISDKSSEASLGEVLDSKRSLSVIPQRWARRCQHLTSGVRGD